jgi:hypothetical protein
LTEYVSKSRESEKGTQNLLNTSHNI